ncbi:hypothetical protein C1646_676071 [Rhizophagus diaphanus]|nr:hypothetical protein C1646_676071 [Rhizophagus diaphanus] [Rhizophagus sp. MUCL 43196]
MFNRNAKNLLEVIDSACVDDPIVIIEWAANPWPRRGRNRTKTDLINYITTNGGTDEFQLGTIFSFRTSRILGNCMGHVPLWSLHDRNNPNIRDVGHCYRINKVADRSAELEDYRVIFNILLRERHASPAPVERSEEASVDTPDTSNYLSIAQIFQAQESKSTKTSLILVEVRHNDILQRIRDLYYLSERAEVVNGNDHNARVALNREIEALFSSASSRNVLRKISRARNIYEIFRAIDLLNVVMISRSWS